MRQRALLDYCKVTEAGNSFLFCFQILYQYLGIFHRQMRVTVFFLCFKFKFLCKKKTFYLLNLMPAIHDLKPTKNLQINKLLNIEK